MRFIIRFLNIIIPKNRHFFYFKTTFIYPDNIDAVLDELLIDSCDNSNMYFYDTPVFRYKGQKNVIWLKTKSSSFWHFLRSKYVFVDNGFFKETKPVKRQTIVNLWHGVSFKKIGFYNKKERAYPTATYVVTYSSFFKKIMSNAFGVEENNVLTTGETRNDYLFKPIDEKIKSVLGLTGYRKIIMWMPTYRQSRFDNLSDGINYPFGFPFLVEGNLPVLNDYCSKNGILLILKWHGLQRLPESTSSNNLKNLKFLTSEELSRFNVPLNSLLSHCDALITDYSSVFINYMLLKRPICFAFDDLEYYEKHRGFMFENIDKYMPGFHAHSFEKVLDFIDSVAENSYKYNISNETRAFFNEHEDGCNSKRLLAFLGLVDEN